MLLTWSTSTDTLGIVAFLEKTVDTTNWELDDMLGIVAFLEKTVYTTNWELDDTLGIVAFLEKMVDTTNLELEPNFHLVIVLVFKRKDEGMKMYLSPHTTSEWDGSKR
jgi:hypothetical protein